MTIIIKPMYCGILALLCLAACYKKGDTVKVSATLVPPGVTTKNVTYTNYISGVLKNNCSTCHVQEGSAAPFWLNGNNYENAVLNKWRIEETLVEGSMPPVPRKPFSEADKELFKAWIERGCPEK